MEQKSLCEISNSSLYNESYHCKVLVWMNNLVQNKINKFKANKKCHSIIHLYKVLKYFIQIKKTKK